MSLRGKLQRLAWRGYMDAAARLHELYSLSWESTTRCNLACAHCASGCGPAAQNPPKNDVAAQSPPLPNGDELSTAEAIALFESVAADFPKGQVRVSISGGEPLMRPDLPDIGARLTGLGLAWGLMSNGLLLSEARLKQLCGAGLGWISFSLDGLAAEHERLRGPRTFKPAVAAIKRAARAGLASVEATTVLTAPLVARLDEMHAFVRTLGVDRWRLQPLLPHGRGAELDALAPSPAQFKAALTWLSARRTEAEPGLELAFDESGYLGQDYEGGQVRDGRFMCGAGVSGAHILADGAVVGCPFMPRAFATGNVRETRFSELWERGFTACRQRGWTKRGPCARCKDYADCRGGCLLQWDSPAASAPRSCMLQMLREAGDA